MSPDTITQTITRDFVHLLQVLTFSEEEIYAYIQPKFVGTYYFANECELNSENAFLYLLAYTAQYESEHEVTVAVTENYEDLYDEFMWIVDNARDNYSFGIIFLQIAQRYATQLLEEFNITTLRPQNQPALL